MMHSITTEDFAIECMRLLNSKGMVELQCKHTYLKFRLNSIKSLKLQIIFQHPSGFLKRVRSSVLNALKELMEECQVVSYTVTTLNNRNLTAPTYLASTIFESNLKIF